MRVLLVGAELEENLALRYLAAALESRGHAVSFATFDRASDAPSVVAAVSRERPDVVAMSMTFQFRAKEFGRLAQDLRAHGFAGHITVGGHFPTFAWSEVLGAFPAIDTVVRHEGEVTLPELCAALAKGEPLEAIRGLALRKDGAPIGTEPRELITDLDALPFPKRTGEPQRHLGIPAAFMVGSRGCYGHCTFCCIHAYIKEAGGPLYRFRSPANVADEMAELRRTRGARMFVFHDDDFFTRDARRDLARMKALRDALRARDVTDVALVVKARPDDVDPEVFAVLQEIGLLRVYLGIEAGSTAGLRVLGRGVDLEANHRALALLRARDVYTCFNMLAFDPESTIASLTQSFEFIRRYADTPMNFCRTEIYVGTPLMTKLAREGRLVGDVFGWDYVIRDPAAERAFRVFATAFLDRNFRCDGLMNATLGLGYHLHLLRQFYPRAVTPALRTLVDEATRAVNLDCADRMLSILSFASSPRGEDAGALAEFTARTTEEVAAANVRLEARVAEATSAIVRAARGHEGEARSTRPLGRATTRGLALSAAALALVACEKTTAPPPDPLPPPTGMSPPEPKTATPPTTPGPGPDAAMIEPVDPPPPPMIVDAGRAPPATAPTFQPPPPDPLPPPVNKKR